MSNGPVVTGCGIPVFGQPRTSATCTPISGMGPQVVGCGLSIFGSPHRAVSCPTLFFSALQTASCPSGSTGGPFTCPQGRFTSSLSQTDADSQATDYLNGILDQFCVPDGSPVFDECGLQNWYLTPSGVPYSNTGDNLIGWEYFAGSSTLSTDGMVIRSNGASDFTTYKLPIVVTDDFTVTCEVFRNLGLSFAFGFLFTDKDVKRTIFTDYGNGAGEQVAISYICDFTANPTGPGSSGVQLNAQPSNMIQIGAWSAVIFKRVGSTFHFSVDGLDVPLYDFTNPISGQLVLGYLGDDTFELRNLTVT